MASTFTAQSRTATPPASTASSLRRLTAEERHAYETNGYVVVAGVFPDHELETVDREIDRLIAEPGTKAGSHLEGWVMAVARRSEIGARFAEDGRLLSLVEDVVYPGIAIHSTKLPYSVDVCHWHHSRNNHTDRVRRAFIVSYQEATLPRGAGEQWKILRAA